MLSLLVPPSALRNSPLLCDARDWPFLDASYKWNHRTRGLLHSFTQHDISEACPPAVQIRTSFLFTVEQYSPGWVHCIVFLRLPDDGHVASFHLLAMVNVAMNICVQVLECSNAFTSRGSILRSRTAGLHGKSLRSGVSG